MGRYLISAACAVLFVVAEIAQLCLCANSSIPSSPCVERERRALLEFKASLSDPSNWLSSWQGVHCCQWEGIGCENDTGHVVKLDLTTPYWACRRSQPSGSYFHNCLEMSDECYELYDRGYVEAANVHPSLLQLEYLTYLDLTGNYFNYSPIPMFIGSMQRLNYLSLSDACFGGRIPSSLGNLTNLHFLDLGWNYFGGRISSSFGNLTSLHLLDLSWIDGLETNNINWLSGLRSLEHLDLSYVSFGSNTHKLFQVNLTNAPQLQVLGLAHIGLTVSNLDALFQNRTSFVDLDLSYNELTSIPSWFGKFEKLEYLDLSRCWLHGPIPDAFINLTSIETLYLSGNNFDFVPFGFRTFEKLKHLDLSYNRFRGPIHDAIRNMDSIELLDLSWNFFTSVPSWFIELKTLLYLYLSRNELTSMECPLSSILRNMCHLKMLDFSGNKLQEESIGRNELSACIRYDLKGLALSDNKFSSRLPSWFSQLENLEYLYLENNLFYGPILFSFKKFPKLKVLDLSNNKFDAAMSNNMGQLVNLTDLDLSNNSFSGTIPQSFGQLVNLQYLNLSNNCLNGSIPQNFSQLVNLSVLDLSRNKLHGSIPVELGQLVNLRQLYLSSNNLDRIITRSSVFPDLRSLDLSNNQISGSLPDYIGHIMTNMSQLFLGNNLIIGSIPNSLCQTKLTSLDISNNGLSGEIPNCWKDSTYWDEINFSSNKLSGVFPSSFGNLSSLSLLHLNNNSLQGELPVSLRYLKQLLILDLGENKFSSNIPSWAANTFPSLQILRLQRNMMSGSIPSQLCQLSSLKILDLSRNYLQGSIPECIGNLQGMSLDQLSSNTPTREYAYFMDVVGAPVEQQWSNEDIKKVMKGMELYFNENLVLATNMDLSNNKLDGVIPEGITLLNGLHGLNLSNNHLKGELPTMIVDMRSLESFDVSNNQLSGTIPNSMAALIFLSILNFAHNNFSGPIPLCNQFVTFDASIYANNPYLCGLPLPNKCLGDNSSHQAPIDKGIEYEDGKISKLEKWLFYFVVAVGFATGFWGVIGVLLVKKSLRHAYFRWVEDAADMIFVAIAVNLSKLKK